MDAPDFARALEAWRIWRVVARRDGYLLGSVAKPTLWRPGEALAAECLHRSLLVTWFRRRRRATHYPPEELCACGVYGGWLPGLDEYLAALPGLPAVARVIGRVSLWGRVIECERGFRGSYAYPLRLYVPVDAAVRPGHRWEDLVAGLERYGVPVEALPTRCAEAGPWLERIQLALHHQET